MAIAQPGRDENFDTPAEQVIGLVAELATEFGVHSRHGPLRVDRNSTGGNGIEEILKRQRQANQNACRLVDTLAFDAVAHGHPPACPQISLQPLHPDILTALKSSQRAFPVHR